MGKADYLALGTWNAQCSMCGSKYKASELKRYWTGTYRCTSCWEPRHPQDFVRGVQDVQTVPWSQPDNWVLVPGAPDLAASATAGIAIAGVAIAGYNIVMPQNPPN